MNSVDDKILQKMKKAKRGSLFFVDDFLIYGSAKTVLKALERLANKGAINRVARGIYARLKIDDYIGPVMPSLDEIAKALRKRDKAKLIPSGNLALNLLGLTNQIPTNYVYLTDATARKVNIGEQSIIFKKTTPKNLACIGEISSLVIQALKTIGKENLSEDEELKILEHLKSEEKYRLKHDINLAPEWIRKVMRKALSS